MPGMGDDIQSLKAGLMEIGDIFVSTNPIATAPSALNNNSGAF